MKQITIILILVVVAFGLYFVFSSSGNVGSYLKGTITNTTSSVGMTTTELISAGDNLKHFEMYNLGSGQIDCAFGADAVLNTGRRLNPVGTSTLTKMVVDEPDLIGKAMDCIADATSTVQILEY